MVKGIERGVTVERIALLEKSGGRSGDVAQRRRPGDDDSDEAERCAAAILTISTSRAAGEGDDESGDALAEFAGSLGAEIAGREVIPDDRESDLAAPGPLGRCGGLRPGPHHRRHRASAPTT